MNILYLTVNSPPLFSGRAKQALFLSDYIKTKGYNVHTISLDSHELGKNSKFLRLLYSKKASNLYNIIKYIIKNNINLVHIHGLSYTLLLAPVLRLLGVKVGMHMSCEGYDDPVTLSNRVSTKFFVPCLSFFIVQKFKYENISKNRFYVENAISIDIKENKKTNKRPKVVLSGVFSPRKRQLEVIKWASNYVDSVDFYFIGSYCNNYHEYSSSYVERCLELSSGYNNVYLLGQLDKNGVSDVLASSDAFMAISKTEGLSNAYVEALAYDLTPIIFDNYVDDLFSSLSIVNQIISVPSILSGYKIIDLESCINSSNINIAYKIKEDFSIEKVSRKIIEIYQRC